MESRMSIDALLDDFVEKSLEVGDFSDAILNAEQLDNFILQIEDRSNVLQRTRREDMESHIVKLDRTGFSGRISRSGSDSTGAHRDLTDADSANPDFFQSRLEALEIVAETGIRDRALRRNLEQEGFESTLLNLFGDAVYDDLEEYALLADTNIAYADDNFLFQTDGWIKLAQQHVFGADSTLTGGPAADFDPTGLGSPDPAVRGDAARSILMVMHEALPKKYMTDPGEFVFFVTYELYDAYREYWISRHTGGGDAVLRTGAQPDYKGIPVVYAPMLQRSGDADRMALLSHPDNMAWGIFHEVTIEPDRIPKGRKTDFVLTYEGDVTYEDPGAAVSAFFDRAADGSA